MIKKYVFLTGLFLIAILLAGCAFEQGDFKSLDFAPETATEVKVYSGDFEGDQVKENILYYKNLEEVKEDQWVLIEHLNIYKKIADEWQSVYNLSCPYERYSVQEEGRLLARGVSACKISTIRVVDAGNDLKEELFIIIDDKLEDKWKFNDYKLIGYKDKNIKELEFPRGFDGKTPGMRLEDTGEFYGHLINVRIDDGEIIEHWGGLCEGGGNYCYYFDFFTTYDPQKDGWSISKAQNAQKNEERWQKWVEEYNSGVDPWDGDLHYGVPLDAD